MIDGVDAVFHKIVCCVGKRDGRGKREIGSDGWMRWRDLDAVHT